MNQATRPTTTAQPVLDRKLSAHLDCIVIALDDPPTDEFQRLLLRLAKHEAELQAFATKAGQA